MIAPVSGKHWKINFEKFEALIINIKILKKNYQHWEPKSKLICIENEKCVLCMSRVSLSVPRSEVRLKLDEISDKMKPSTAIQVGNLLTCCTLKMEKWKKFEMGS